MAKVDWKLCAEWLIKCQVLPAEHPVASDNAEVFDLAQLLRDGVILCHLANRLHPGAVDPKDFCLRPQMSQVRTSYHWLWQLIWVFCTFAPLKLSPTLILTLILIVTLTLLILLNPTI